MALTRDYRETVLERIRRDPEFTAALYAEAIVSLVEGDRETALSTLRDLVHAHISFKTLARQTGFGEKALHRMLGRNGNPNTWEPDQSHACDRGRLAALRQRGRALGQTETPHATAEGSQTRLRVSL